MSAIGGIYNFDEAPIDMQMFANLSAALDSRGPDGGREIHNGSVGIIYRAFHTNKESRMEKQPLVTRYGHILAWDGRVDNREELLREFPDGLEGDKTDVALVMAAYLKWGGEFLQKVIGDFVLSLWDPSEKRLLLARDPFGSRTLYYYSNRDRIVWASTLGALLRLTDIEIQVDDEYVAGFLASQPEMWRTPYLNMFAVEPGFTVVPQNGVTDIRRFWHPDPNKEIRYKSDEEYEEHFRHLFKEAVRVRLRSDGPVWAELSGGLDSSSIVCMADQIIHSGDANTHELKTVSYVDSTSTSNDSIFIPIVEKKRGQEGYHINRESQWLRLVSPEESFISKPKTGLCVSGLRKQLHNEMSKNNARVLLSGLGGDQVTWSTPESSLFITDLIYKRRFLELHKHLQIWSLATKSTYFRTLIRESLSYFLPNFISARLQPSIEPIEWLDKSFIKRCNFLERQLLPPDTLGQGVPSRRIQSSHIQYVVACIAEGKYQESADVEEVYPFLHRPFVEFQMAIPIEQKLTPDQTRYLMRRALKDLLPKEILNRKDKGMVGEIFCRGLSEERSKIDRLLNDARVCRRGYVDYKSFRESIDKARHGKQENIAVLLATLALEIWLRSIEYHFQIRT